MRACFVRWCLAGVLLANLARADVGREPVVAPLPLTPAIAQAMVRAALEHAGLPARERALSSIGRRAHTSALLPTLHARFGTWSAMSEQIDTTDHTATSAHVNLSVDVRLAWSLDRLLYASDELALARLRDEAVSLSEKLSSRVAALLSAWQRASVRRHLAVVLSADALDAQLAMFELQIELDSLTGGDFGRWAARLPP